MKFLFKRYASNLVFFLVIFFCPLIIHAEDTTSEYLSRFSLREKVGQLMIIGVKGPVLSPAEIDLIKIIKPAGFIFYKRNFKDSNELKSLITEIKLVFESRTLPHFFVLDQEGGIVHRLEDEQNKTPSHPSLGAADSEKLAMNVGRSIGNKLINLGINLNLAPVLDMPSDIVLSPMSMRSFGNNPFKVEKLGVAFIRGTKETGLLTTAKHFPGLGRAIGDSHSVLPRVVWESEDEKEKDIRPFKSAIAASVDAVMLGHFIATPGDPDYPASLSRYWMTDVLRKEMGFNGLIIVDNIEMQAIEDVMPASKAAVTSLKAGADIIMISHERKKQELIYNALLDAVVKGDISMQRIDESLLKIRQAKMKIQSSSPSINEDNLGSIARTVAENSIVVLQQRDRGMYPLAQSANVLYAGYNMLLIRAIKESLPETELLNMSPQSHAKKNSESSIQDFLRKFNTVVIDADYQQASELVSLCKKLKIKHVLLLTHPKSFQKMLEKVAPEQMIIIFENNELYFQAVVDVILGHKPSRGKLPYDIKLPNDYIYSSSML